MTRSVPDNVQLPQRSETKGLAQAEALSLLIVDDMKFSRAFLRSALSNAGYIDIRTTDSGTHALDLVRERKADVMLVNWVMPEMSGLEITQHIRQLDEMNSHYTAIILFTAKEGTSALVEAFENGVDDYLRIPVDNQELGGRVLAAGRLSHLQNALLRKSKTLAANHQRELITLNLIDPLTNLGNVRYLYNRLETVFQEVVEQEGGVTLTLIELEGLAQLKGKGGRRALGALLEASGQRLRAAVRPSDIVAHLGDGRFACAIHRAEPQPFDYAVFERLLHAVEAPLGERVPGTVDLPARLGGCHYNLYAGRPSIDRLLECATNRLLEAREVRQPILVKSLETS